VGAVVLYGIPREVLVNDPWGAQRTVMLDGMPAIYPRVSETVQLVEGSDRPFTDWEVTECPNLEAHHRQ
jgi:D-aminopeptidase